MNLGTAPAPLLNQLWSESGQFFEYASAANPRMPAITVTPFPASLHQIAETPIVPLDLSSALGVGYPATGPALLAHYVHIAPGDDLATRSHASSQIFYVIRGSGCSTIAGRVLQWKAGDLFALPASADVMHQATEDTAFYWVNDQPLMDYLGVQPVMPRCRSLYFPAERLTRELDIVRQANQGKDRNRNGILLANPDCPQTKTLTHSMWSLYNLLPAGSRQKAHRHNSIAIDFAVRAQGQVYTLIGEKIDSAGNIINPIRADWVSGSSFVTPPGWWHSHHNESVHDAIVLPIQDAGLHTYLQTLDIQFSNGY